jgi:hypothetical protein
MWNDIHNVVGFIRMDLRGLQPSFFLCLLCFHLILSPKTYENIYFLWFWFQISKAWNHKFNFLKCVCVNVVEMPSKVVTLLINCSLLVHLPFFICTIMKFMLFHYVLPLFVEYFNNDHEKLTKFNNGKIFHE